MELKAGGMIAIARKHGIRITTNVPGSSNANGVESIFRPMRGITVRLLLDANLGMEWREYAEDYFEDAYAMRPSREAPGPEAHRLALRLLTSAG